MNPTTKMVYVPPRPNLGPEPMTEPTATVFLAATFAILVLLLVIFARRHRRRPGRSNSANLPANIELSLDDSPGQRLIDWSVATRETLATRFGPGWRAKTTEEIASDVSLSAALGDKVTARLIVCLIAADRAKFALGDSSDQGLEIADDDLQALTQLLATSASSARSGP